MRVRVRVRVRVGLRVGLRVRLRLRRRLRVAVEREHLVVREAVVGVAVHREVCVPAAQYVASTWQVRGEYVASTWRVRAGEWERA